MIKDLKDGVKILGGVKKMTGQLPSGLKFRDVLFSASAREALGAAGATLGDATRPPSSGFSDAESSRRPRPSR